MNLWKNLEEPRLELFKVKRFLLENLLKNKLKYVIYLKSRDLGDYIALGRCVPRGLCMTLIPPCRYLPIPKT